MATWGHLVYVCNFNNVFFLLLVNLLLAISKKNLIEIIIYKRDEFICKVFISKDLFKINEISISLNKANYSSSSSIVLNS